MRSPLAGHWDFTVCTGTHRRLVLRVARVRYLEDCGFAVVPLAADVPHAPGVVHRDVVHLVAGRVEGVRGLDNAPPVRLEGGIGQRRLDKVAEEVPVGASDEQHSVMKGNTSGVQRFARLTVAAFHHWTSHCQRTEEVGTAGSRHHAQRS